MCTLNGSEPPNGSNADKSEGLNAVPLFLFTANGSSGGSEKAANGSLRVLCVEENGSAPGDRLSSVFSSTGSSKWELVLKPLMLDTGLLEPAWEGRRRSSYMHIYNYIYNCIHISVRV